MMFFSDRKGEMGVGRGGGGGGEGIRMYFIRSDKH